MIQFKGLKINTNVKTKNNVKTNNNYFEANELGSNSKQINKDSSIELEEKQTNPIKKTRSPSFSDIKVSHRNTENHKLEDQQQGKSLNNSQLSSNPNDKINVQEDLKTKENLIIQICADWDLTYENKNDKIVWKKFGQPIPKDSQKFFNAKLKEYISWHNQCIDERDKDSKKIGLRKSPSCSDLSKTKEFPFNLSIFNKKL